MTLSCTLFSSAICGMDSVFLFDESHNFCRWHSTYYHVRFDNSLLVLQQWLLFQSFTGELIALIAEIKTFSHAAITHRTVGPPRPSTSQAAAHAGFVLRTQPSYTFQEFILFRSLIVLTSLLTQMPPFYFMTSCFILIYNVRRLLAPERAALVLW
jgi:hypothetical protein